MLIKMVGKIHVVHRQGTEEIDVKEFTKTLQKYFAKFTETQSETILRIDNKKILSFAVRRWN